METSRFHCHRSYFEVLITMLRDVVAQGPSKSRRIKNDYGYFFPQSNAYAQVNGPRNRGLSKQIAMGLWSCHREKAAKGACIITQAARD